VPFNVSPPSDRSLNFTQRPLDDGYLLSVTAQTIGATLPKRGQTWVQLTIARPPVSGFRLQRVLAADYLSGANALGWPYGRIISPSEGPGAFYSVLGSAPAAGADWIQTVPTGARWRIRGIRATFTASSTGPTRGVRLQVDDGANILYVTDEPSNFNTAGTYPINYIPGLPVLSSVVVANAMFMPPDLILYPGYRISSSTFGIIAGDQWGAPRFFVEEWLED
jgi:hypothetical protein